MSKESPMKEPEQDLDDVSEEEESESEEDHRERMLAMLNARCSAMTGFSIPAAALPDAQDEEDDEEEDDEEWSGIEDSDGEIGSPEEVSKAPVVVFDDRASTSKRTLEVIANEGRDSFMSSKIRHIPAESNDTSSRKGKSRATAAGSEEALEEAHLASLDASLLSLIKDLPSDHTGATPQRSKKFGGNRSAQVNSLLPHLSSSLVNPRHTVRKDREAVIDRRAPRQLQEALYTARLGRAKTRAEQEKESGVISAGSGGYALTKKKRREQTGKEDDRRKKAKGLGGVVGKMRKGGGMLTLSRDEVKKGQEGDFDSLMGRKRKGPPGGGKSGGKRRK